MNDHDWRFGFITGAVTSFVLLITPAIVSKIIGL